MKRLLTVLIAVLLIISLAACGSNNDKTSTDGKQSDAPLIREDDAPHSTPGAPDTEKPPENFDFASAMAGKGATDTVWGKQDAATRQSIVDSAKEGGYDVSFGADGSMTITDTDGTVIVQQPDGTWVMKDADGSSAQFGGEWPENEFTKLVPKPNFDVMGASSDDGSFTVAFSGVEIEQVKAYADKVKAKGFTIDATEESQNVYGVSIYTYTAYNSDGYCVEITFANGTSGITISK